MKNSSGSIAPLPPYPPTGEVPAYESLEEIILDLWEYCLYLEYEYYKTNNKEILFQFTFCIGLIQYWEDIYFSIGGRNGFGVHL